MRRTLADPVDRQSCGFLSQSFEEAMLHGDLCNSRWLLFVGPTKTGTSWVDKVLRGVDGVCLPYAVKETFFFTKNFHRGIEWYSKQFACKADDPLYAEVGPTYFFGKSAAERIRDIIPEARIVVSLRDPVQRAVSQYLHMRKYGRTDLDMAQALECFPSITLHSIYAARLQRWFEVFGQSNVQVIFYEEVVGNVPKLFEEVLTKAALHPSKRVEDTELGCVNAAAVPRSQAHARLGQNVATKLRETGWHSVIALGKTLGLRKILFSGGVVPDKRELESTLVRWQPKFAEDLEALIGLLGRRPPWRAG
jgi:hypothetical protein